jgi:mRNA interferase RelE/StbE
MAWQIEVSDGARSQIKKLDPPVARRLVAFLYKRLALLDDPRSLGEALQAKDKLWRYRVGDYRIICSLEDDRLVVLVLKVGHRREVYR